MKVYLIPALIVCVGLFALAEQSSAQTKDDPKGALSAFKQLSAVKVKSSGGARDGKRSPRIDVADLPISSNSNQPIAGAVKIWAVRADASGKETSGPVSILHEKWQPNDYLYFYFESATPSIVSLYQLYPLTGYPGQKESRVVIPNDQFPVSFDPIGTGSAVRLPLLMRMDNTRTDEEIAFSILTVGIDDPSGSLDTGDQILDDTDFIDEDITLQGQGGSIAFRGKLKSYAEKAGKAALRKEIPKGARIDIAGAGSSASSNNIDDVAVTAVFCGRIAFIKLTMHKD